MLKRAITFALVATSVLGAASTARAQSPTEDSVVGEADGRDAQPPRRMVGKGLVASANGRAGLAYAYILRCDGSDPRFGLRLDGFTFQIEATPVISCTDDPAVSTPAAGFDTQTGTAVGSIRRVDAPFGAVPGTLEWEFVDGGTGGANDSARISILTAAGTPFFEGSAAPPRAFPESTQTTGYNSAQLLP